MKVVLAVPISYFSSEFSRDPVIRYTVSGLKIGHYNSQKCAYLVLDLNDESHVKMVSGGKVINLMGEYFVEATIDCKKTDFFNDISVVGLTRGMTTTPMDKFTVSQRKEFLDLLTNNEIEIFVKV